MVTQDWERPFLDPVGGQVGAEVSVGRERCCVPCPGGGMILRWCVSHPHTCGGGLSSSLFLSPRYLVRAIGQERSTQEGPWLGLLHVLVPARVEMPFKHILVPKAVDCGELVLWPGLSSI